MRHIVRVAALCLAAGSAFAQNTTCPVPVYPIPTGRIERPGEKIGLPRTPEEFESQQDYRWMHSSTNLQGYATTEKFAPCLFFKPTDHDLSAALGGFQSALAINNPSPTATAHVSISLFDRNGNPWSGNPIAVTLGPNENWANGVPQLQSFANGVGSAVIKSDIPIVGASQHYIGSVKLGGRRFTDIDPGMPGEGTMQQIQAAQPEGTSLYAGPIPIGNSSRHDFLNGNLPFLCMMNTTRSPANITIYKGATDSSGAFIPMPTITASLPGYGQYIDMSLWQGLEPAYLSSTSLPLEANGWAFVSSPHAPLVGDMYLADFFAGGSPSSPRMSPGRKFRVGSAMMANKPAAQLTSPELTQQRGSIVTPVSPGLDTMIGLTNASTTNIGPVVVNYRDRDGAIVGTRTIASFAPGESVRLTSGTPGFPSMLFDGWAEINACRDGLIGWTMREVRRVGNLFQYEKAYGEELAGANAREPGKGIPVTVQGLPVVRKIAPLARVSPGLAWPSYTTFTNNSVGNIGNYWFRSYQFQPLTGDVTNYTPQPFIGLPFGSSAFTYQDGGNSLVNIGFDQNVGSRVDTSNATVIGMTAAGDPLREWDIENFPASGP
ncbi:MAG: hypothetical protein KA144_02445 [Xanthomonadaceae bacterium]|nr:hypothetical protein [Xanthomonadaceae bacterium]